MFLQVSVFHTINRGKRCGTLYRRFAQVSTCPHSVANFSEALVERGLDHICGGHICDGSKLGVVAVLQKMLVTLLVSDGHCCSCT